MLSNTIECPKCKRFKMVFTPTGYRDNGNHGVQCMACNALSTVEDCRCQIEIDTLAGTGGGE